jgi:GT2 family glycosyltransferase
MRIIEAPRLAAVTTNDHAPDRQSFGILVTFKRPDLLQDHLDRLARQTLPLDTLLVVDNAGDDGAIRRIAESSVGRAAAGVEYLALSGNPGPAGGFTAGIAHLGDRMSDDDVVVLLDDNDPPWSDKTFAILRDVFDRVDAETPALGVVGTWGASLRFGGRLRGAEGDVPEMVDYVAGGGCPHYKAGAARNVGGPTPELFFGFEELDFGLALKRAGYSVWSSGRAPELKMASSAGRKGIGLSVEPPTWRRYYSLRNLIAVLRKDGRWLDAVAMSLVAGIAKPVLNLVVSPRLAMSNLRLNALALRHAWTGKLGKLIDPEDLPALLK